MKPDHRLSAVLHALLHMAHQSRPMTSEQLAQCMSTNPVVVRRTMAGLREAGFVRSSKGHGGGWEMARPLEAITLADIHAALGAPRLVGLGLGHDNPSCLVEQAVQRQLAETLHAAEALIVTQFGAVTLAALAADFRAHAPDPSTLLSDHSHA